MYLFAQNCDPRFAHIGRGIAQPISHRSTQLGSKVRVVAPGATTDVLDEQLDLQAGDGGRAHEFDTGGY